MPRQARHGQEESKPTTQLSPLLYDLTSLQREANGRFGFSAKTTLALAQALYEKHKALTYPRTDSRYLPEDYIATVKETLKSFSGTPYAPFAGQILKGGWAHPNKRIFNNAKVSDHFAIIPTGAEPKHLSEAEQKLYDLVTKRFLAIFFPAAEYNVTTRITRVEGEAFKTEGKVLVAAGWLAVYGKEAQGEDETPSLVPVKPKERVWANDVEVKANQTKPPARFTEATLLTAMEGAGKLIEEEELREAMSARGLGTPGDARRHHRGPHPRRVRAPQRPRAAADGQGVLADGGLSTLGIDELHSPELTGHWEYKLKQMEHGELERNEFMDHIVEQTREMVDRIKHGEIPEEVFSTLTTPCPKCGGVIQENYKKFQCKKCDYALWKVVAGRQYEPEEVDELLSRGVVGPLQGFRSKMGRPFAAMIRLNTEHLPEFDFGQGSAGEATVKRSTSAARNRSANARSAASGSTSTAWPTSARRPSGPTRPAISARARSSCSSRWSARRWASCSRRAHRPAQGLHLEQDAPQVLRLSGQRQRRQGRLRVRAARAQGRRQEERRKARGGAGKSQSRQDGGKSAREEENREKIIRRNRRRRDCLPARRRRWTRGHGRE
jgi:DNA topoisomerase-3